RGAEIPLAARIFTVADVFDALCSKRPYKVPMDFSETMAILEQDSGSHFDPAVMAVFLPIAREIYDRLASCDEDGIRQLLVERVRQHFGL
ncbi:MAG: metal-dependent phosphohydrolase, partial [Betaproteobacteria bacterium]|nr:metal-dependent phosphohydrolase [Betaproteobacteria bacterium]